MRLTHSSLFALTTVITSSLLYQVQSAPLNEVDTVSDKDHTVVAFDVQSQNQHTGLNEWTQHLDKRCNHSHAAARRRSQEEEEGHQEEDYPQKEDHSQEEDYQEKDHQEKDHQEKDY
ncbi:hypothetical protein EDC96DRAFT_189421 [Choanephora cucurbitarum]|nr:hypothetical protein EDC96DRAFT_189421 [Choanephora cucurbitarum]